MLIGTSQPHAISSSPTSGTQVKRAIPRWIELLIMENRGCSLTFTKVTNPNIIKAMAKTLYITHPPN